MQFKMILTTAALSMLLGLNGAAAQSLRDNGEPAEFPPASFTGKQYIDSKGCVYIRAGFDGAVTWVPRVSRKRAVLCGYAPTFASKPAPEAQPPVVMAAPAVSPPRVASATMIKPVSKPVPKPVIKPVIKPVAARTKPPVTPTRRVVASAPVRMSMPTETVASAPTRVYVVPPTRLYVAAPRRVYVAPANPATTAPRVATAPTASAPAQTVTCGATPLSQRYLQTSSGFVVRCTPQTLVPGSYQVNDASGLSFDGVISGTGELGAVTVIAPPPGYRTAWTDDRLNPNRGVQTAAGIQQSALIWTNTVPRRLIGAPKRNVVTKAFPFLKFAFSHRRSVDDQIAYRLNIGEPVAAATGAGTTTRYSTKAVAPDRAVAPPARATVVARPSAVPAGHRFVQVGMFTEPANANSSAARVQALGLPVRVGSYLKAGKTYRIVLAGPFGSTASLQTGLNTARRAGFPDAYTRQ